MRYRIDNETFATVTAIVEAPYEDGIILKTVDISRRDDYDTVIETVGHKSDGTVQSFDGDAEVTIIK